MDQVMSHINTDTHIPWIYDTYTHICYSQVVNNSLLPNVCNSPCTSLVALNLMQTTEYSPLKSSNTHHKANRRGASVLPSTSQTPSGLFSAV
jgi:hypothetical protein